MSATGRNTAGLNTAGLDAADPDAAGRNGPPETSPEVVAPGPDLRLLPAAAGAWLLAWWATAERARTVLIVALILLLAVGALIALLVVRKELRWRRAASVTLVLALSAAVLAVTGLRLLARERDPLTRAAAGQLTGSVIGRVSGDPRQLATPSVSGAPRYAVRISTDQLIVQGRAVPSSGLLLVLGGPAWGAVVAGTHVRVTGKLVPGEAGDAASALVFPRGSPAVIDRGSWIWRVAERLRIGLRRACEGLPADARGLLPALVVGDTSQLSPRLRTDLQAAGLTHLTAVSGGNVAILAAVVIALIAGLGGGRRVRALGTGLAIAGFVVLARPEPSVLRAAVMGGLALIGLLQARRGAGVPMLATTAWLLLLVDPWLSRSYGFVLSVLATAGLLLLVPAWTRRFHRWPRTVVLALAVPAAAQVATAPVTVLLNPAVSLIAVPANLLVAAAVGPATVAGIGAAALSVVWPFGAALVAFAGGLATEWIAIVAHRAAQVPGGSVPWPAGLAGAGLLAALSVIAVMLSLRRSWVVLGAGLVVVAGFLVGPRVVAVLTSNSGWPPADWLIVQCDVGQGSATLIRSGPERAVIVDAGPDPDLVDTCLRRSGVETLDLIVITHFHADHAEGLEGAVRGRGRPPIVLSPLAEPDDQVRSVRAIAAADRLPMVTGVLGMTGQAGTGGWAVRWRLVAPPPAGPARVRPGADPGGTEINNASVVLAAQVQGVRVMALGDVEPEAQQLLLRTLLGDPSPTTSNPPLVPVDVVVVAHHGSARQEDRLYRLLRPRVALIGVGADNDYGHPAPSTMALLHRLGVLSLRTDLQGHLAVSGPPDRLRVMTSK